MILEGTLILKLDDGRTLSALVFGEAHAVRTLERWGRDECSENYQAASGDFIQCVRAAGHNGPCGHREIEPCRARVGSIPCPNDSEGWYDGVPCCAECSAAIEDACRASAEGGQP